MYRSGLASEFSDPINHIETYFRFSSCDQLNEGDARKMANDGQDIDLYADDLEFNQVGRLARFAAMTSDGGLNGSADCPVDGRPLAAFEQKRMQFANRSAQHQLIMLIVRFSYPAHRCLQDATEFNDQNVDLYDDVITQSRQGKNSSSANNSHHDNEYGPNNREHSGNAPNSNEFHSHHHHHQHHSTNEIQSNPSSNSSSGKKIGIYVGNLTWVCISLKTLC